MARPNPRGDVPEVHLTHVHDWLAGQLGEQRLAGVLHLQSVQALHEVRAAAESGADSLPEELLDRYSVIWRHTRWWNSRSQDDHLPSFSLWIDAHSAIFATTNARQLNALLMRATSQGGDQSATRQGQRRGLSRAG